MNQRPLSRRNILVAGAAASATAAGLATFGTGITAGAADGTQGSGETVGDFLRLDTLTTIAAGEQVLFIPASSMSPNGKAEGTTSVFSGRGFFPSNPGIDRYLSAAVNLPLFSRIVNIEWAMNGTAQVGRVALIKFNPEAAGVPSEAVGTDVSGAGYKVYSVAPPQMEVYDGNQTYEVNYKQTGAAVATSVIEAVRVRYLPPGQALVPVTPVRVYDSRLNMAPDTNGTIGSGSTRTISVANVRNVTTGATTGVDAVPANATAVAFTLTLADTALQGFLAVNPGGVTTVSASTINWKASGLDLANTGVVKLGPNRTLTVIAGGGGSTNFVVDIVGYYM